MRGRFGQQIIADLPKYWVGKTRPFTYCGVDLFAPFIVKERWSEIKKYGAFFTCIATRTVHIEVLVSIETHGTQDNYIKKRNRTIRSDNGSNFTGRDNLVKSLY